MFHQIAMNLDFDRKGRLFASVRMAAAALAGVAAAVAAREHEGLELWMSLGIVVLALILMVQVTRSARHITSRSDLVRQAAVQAEQHYISVLRRIVRIVEARDRYTQGHSHRVGHLGGRMARQMGLAATRCEALVVAGELLDIGLLAVSDEILGKRSGFGPRDFMSMQKHSELSYEVLKPLASLAEVIDGVRCHHERMNGTGYPQGLVGQDIPLEARILAVADSYDAMTHDRPHRPAIPSMQAMEEIRRCSPAGYDALCVAALAKVLNLADAAEEAAIRASAGASGNASDASADASVGGSGNASADADLLPDLAASDAMAGHATMADATCDDAAAREALGGARGSVAAGGADGRIPIVMG